MQLSTALHPPNYVTYAHACRMLASDDLVSQSQRVNESIDPENKQQSRRVSELERSLSGNSQQSFIGDGDTTSRVAPTSGSANIQDFSEGAYREYLQRLAGDFPEAGNLALDVMTFDEWRIRETQRSGLVTQLGEADLLFALETVASGERVAPDTRRLADRDAIDFILSGADGRTRNESVAARDAYSDLFRQAENALPGDAQLVMGRLDDSPMEALVGAIRASGGYFSERGGQSLLDQINSGAPAIDLTLARAESQVYLDDLLNGSEFRSLVNDDVKNLVTGFNRIPGDAIGRVSEYRRNQLINSDSLLPAGLDFSGHIGIDRTVDRALTTVSLLSAVGEIGVGIPLLLARRGSKGVIASGVGANNVPNNTGLIGHSDEIGDFLGSAPSARTQKILDRFDNSRRVDIYDAGTGETIPVQIVDGLTRRQVKVNDLGKLQNATGSEFSLLRGPNGDRVLIQGTVNRTAIPQSYVDDGYKWSGHSHPYSPVASPEDRLVLQALGQESSVIKSSASGETRQFFQFEDLSNWLPGQ